MAGKVGAPYGNKNAAGGGKGRSSGSYKSGNVTVTKGSKLDKILKRNFSSAVKKAWK